MYCFWSTIVFSYFNILIQSYLYRNFRKFKYFGDCKLHYENIHKSYAFNFQLVYYYLLIPNIALSELSPSWIIPYKILILFVFVTEASCNHFRCFPVWISSEFFRSSQLRILYHRSSKYSVLQSSTQVFWFSKKLVIRFIINFLSGVKHEFQMIYIPHTYPADHFVVH